MEHFQTVTNRKQTSSYKWDQLDTIFNNDDIIPLWVADMDFKAPVAVNEVLKKRAEHGIYGYTVITDAIRDTVVQWNAKRHNWDISPDWLTFSPGVIASLHIAIQSFTMENDKILIQTPVYTPFFNIIRNGNRQIVKNSLVEKNSKYEMDFED